ncbi:peptidylprolyl isomerase [Novosphingobium sp. AAP83]|uniref:peptidylprolyl isomerase n=1 Tax=Novosphingobium sp. AAP83 TaxID=1523425 RepID=UPI0009E90A4B|nr:peptidylprolyl isomerase [Novosphingobium sp. AAP83]
MSFFSLIAAAAAAASPAPAAAAKAEPVLAPSEIVAGAPASDWSAIAASDVLVMDLAPDAAQRPRRVVIQLLPAPFSQGWIGNIRKLAGAHWWDGTSINRAQDNYVVQWGDADGEDKAKAMASPGGLAVVPQSEYVTPNFYGNDGGVDDHIGFAIERKTSRDPYAATGMFHGGFPVAGAKGSAWPVHCYGSVGVGRNEPPDTGTGAELYAVIGHAPRQLDRNIAVVGRVIEGMEHLSTLPRGTGDIGFYKTPEERTPIRSIRIGSDVADLPRFEYLNTESASFARYADARANRRDAFYIQPAGGVDICNVPVPVRRVK